MNKFFIQYRKEIMLLFSLLLVTFGITALQNTVSVPVGLLLVAIMVIVYLTVDFVLPKNEVATRSLTEEKDVSLWAKTRTFIVYIGSFGLGLVVFLLSGEEPAPGLIPGPWGSVALVLTFAPPLVYSILWNRNSRK